MNADTDYQARIQAEREIFAANENIHDLPKIFHYWSIRWLQPKMLAVGINGPIQLFEKYLLEQCKKNSRSPLRFVSIGAGNCDTEVGLVRQLRDQGYSNFVMDCLELNPAMIERGRELARQHGVQNQLNFVECDFNQWKAEESYNVAIANQSLHHVSNLEGLFEQVASSLKPDGQFLISDMIGRNGHMRWPEALEIVHEFWRELPDSYRYNILLKRQEELYENWDCSTESFEGIRAQEVLPLLIRYFHFQLFVPFSNVIAPFIDRAFGHHFNAEAEWDRDFIDRVHLRDESEMRAGRLKPTQMVAVVGTDANAPCIYHPPFTPEFCVRRPGPPPQGQDESLYDRIEEMEHQLTNAESNAAASAAKLETAEWQIKQAAGSKWMRLGRRLGLGPEFR